MNGRGRIYTQAVWPVRASISPTCPLPRGAVVSQVVHAWDRGPAGAQGWEGPGCAGGLPAATWAGLLRGPESQPCILGSWLCPGHPWGLSHRRAHPALLPASYLGLGTGRPSDLVSRQAFTLLPTLGAGKRYLFAAPEALFYLLSPFQTISGWISRLVAY